MSDTTIERIDAWACSVPLPHPLSFGSFEIAAREYVAVRVRTSGGLVADCLGLSRKAPVDVAVLDVLAPLVIGRDGAAVSARLQDCVRGTRALDRDGVLARARSLLENAMWNLLAQEAGLPLWRLLGGDPRELPVLLVEGYSLPDESDDDFAARLAARVEEGYSALKIEAASYSDPDRLARRLTKTRELVGYDAELVVDAVWSWPNARAGLEAARAWSACKLGWIEDPLPRWLAAETARLRSQIDSPIGAGDEATRPSELRDLLAADAVDVLRMDATTVGGIHAVDDLATRATEAGRRPSLHVNPELHQHCAFAWTAFDHIEAFPLDRPFDSGHQLLEQSFMEGVRRGQASPPDEPGTGVRLDLNAVQGTCYRHGSVGLEG